MYPLHVALFTYQIHSFAIPLEIVTLDVRLIYKRSSITTTVITIASTMMVMTTLEAMAAVFVDACDEGKKVREQNDN